MKNIDFYKLNNLANKINYKFKLSDIVKRAFSTVDRAKFVPKGFAHAYEIDSFPIIGGQYISSPLTVAQMSSYLECEGADSVLEIGLGSGYQAVILSKLVRRVYSVERVKKLYDQALQVINSEDIYNISVKYGDGSLGWASHAPYDRILFSCSINSIDNVILSQLKDDGILIAPIIENGEQSIVKIKKINGVFKRSVLSPCDFISLKRGIA